MVRRAVFVLFLVCSVTVGAQDRPPVSPGVGTTVLLAGNSIQLDRDVAVVSGDIVVNGASGGPVLGEAELSLDRGVTTPAGFILAADDIDIDRLATAGGDVFYNRLRNDGTIGGSLHSPLALPVFANLPPLLDRSAGTLDVIVPDRLVKDLDEGSYSHLSVGRGATVRLTGSGYTFASISLARDAAVLFYYPAHVIVAGRLSLGVACTIGPAAGASLPHGSIAFEVHGINGIDGQLFSSPASAEIGSDSTVDANLYVPSGSLLFGQNVDATGSFIAADILAGRNSRFSLGSSWNLAPTAQPQAVFTSGAAPVTITLHGSDPEGVPLVFSISSEPSKGTLGPLSQTSPDSATVTYTPATDGNLEDSFRFRVSDGAGTGEALVAINPNAGDPPGPPATTVVARDAAYEAPQTETTTLLLAGDAPNGLSLTFGIVSGSGPTHGSLGPVTQTSPLTATAAYTPDEGYIGDDSLRFEVCGAIDGTTVCSTGTITIKVLPSQIDPVDLVRDLVVETKPNQELVISLLGGANSRFGVHADAAMLSPAAVAGNVADADGDGVGDNQNDLPGAVPVFMSAAVNETGGGGSQGTARIHIEFDISNLGGSVDQLRTANVILPTHRGTVDQLDTKFIAVATDGDGVLSLSDFAADGEVIPGAVMSVPPLEQMPIGADGTFSFDVLGELAQAVKAGFDHFVIQGRVDESLEIAARGLEVRTTATGNQTGFNVPMLELTTPGITAPLLIRITSLPLYGTLMDTSNNPIGNVPYVLSGSQVKYMPSQGFTGNDFFTFEASNELLVDSAIVNIRVLLGDCSKNADDCNNGR